MTPGGFIRLAATAMPGRSTYLLRIEQSPSLAAQNMHPKLVGRALKPLACAC